MRTTVLAILAFLLSARPCCAQPEPPSAFRAQRDAGVHAREAAAQYDTIAEEIEVNFGRDGASRASAAREMLSGIVERDVPSALREIEEAGAGGSDEPRKSPAQAAILRKLQSLGAPADSSLAAKRLSERAAELAEAQAELRRTTARLAEVDVTGKPDRVQSRFRESVEKLSRSQADIAKATRALDRSANDALATAKDPERERIRGALSEADLGTAAGEADAAAGKLAQDERAQATADQASVLSRLEAMRKALSSGADIADTPARLSELAAQERRLADRSSGDAAERAAGQEQALRDLENAQANMTQPSLEASLANKAAGKMNEASRAFADAAQRSGEDREDKLAGAAKSAEEAAQLLDAAARTAADAKASQRGREFMAAAAAVARERDALEAILRLSQEQREVAQATDSMQPRSDDLRSLSDAQDMARKRAFELSQRRSADGATQPPPGAPSSAEVKDNLAKAAASMKSAAVALSQAKKFPAASEQRAAAGSIDKALEAQARSADSAAGKLAAAGKALADASNLADSEAVASALAEMSGGTQDDSPSQTGNGKPGRGSSGTGPAGLAQGSRSALGPQAQGRAWDARLGQKPEDRATQSGATAFPKGYEESLKRYYEAIARQ